MHIKNVLTLAIALAVTLAKAQSPDTTTTTTTTTTYTHIWDDPGIWWGSHWERTPGVDLYNPMELSLDLFGSYINPEVGFVHLFDSNIQHGSWGGGAGLNFFFTRMLGIGTDFNVSDHQGYFYNYGGGGFYNGHHGNTWAVDDWVGNIYVRFPLWNTGLAPYIYGGGGRGMYPAWDWVYGGGVGLEFRFTPGISIFSDARFLWSNESTALNTLTIRAGLRIAF